jgi:MraZ protein
MSKKGVESVAESTLRGEGESKVLVGQVVHNLDPKRRLTIPSEWRADLGGTGYVYVMSDPFEKCLDLIPQAEMEARLEKLRQKALFDPALGKHLQMIGASSEKLSFDIQGRIRICDRLLRFANLTTTVAMVGAVRMIKLWDPAALAPEAEVDQASLREAILAAEF